MSNVNRRKFLIHAGAGVAATLASSSWPIRTFAQSSGRVVIIGGGFAGATCARYLRRADPSITVTLVERESNYITGPMSNAVIGGLRSMGSITVSFEQLASQYGISVVQGNVVAINTTAQSVDLEGGESLPYDRLVVAPGIDLDYSGLEGFIESVTSRMPHAWKPGPQTQLLRSQLEAMDNGGTVIISVPANPYRCPPGPYERASLIAHYLKRTKPASKILILDTKESFPKQDLFMQGWEALYPGMIEWVPGAFGGAVSGVDPKAMNVICDSERHLGDVINLIPPARAGLVAQVAGLADESGWCPVDPVTFESTLQRGIHVIGDAAQAGKLPKSGAAANAEGKVCAAAVSALMNGKPVGAPSFINACYSLLAPDYAIAIAGVYEHSSQGITPVSQAFGASPLNVSARYRKKEADDAESWYKNIVSDTFG